MKHIVLPCCWCCYHLATWSSHILLRRSQFSHWFVKSTARWRACRIEIIQTGHTSMSWQSPCRSTLTFTTIYCSVSNCSIVYSVVLDSSTSIVVISYWWCWGKGQLISECPFVSFNFPQNQKNFSTNFCPRISKVVKS